MSSCFLAGFFGASAGAAGKVTFESGEDVEGRCLAVLGWTCCPDLVFPLRLLSALLLVSCNVLTLHHFNRALQASSATVQASVVTTAVNLVVTVRKDQELWKKKHIVGVIKINPHFSRHSMVGLCLMRS